MMANRKAIFALALGLSAVLTACDQAEQLDQITAPPAFNQGASKKLATLIRTNAAYSGCVGATVNPSGGTLVYASGAEAVATLVVPRKSVSAGTDFTICPTTDGTLGFVFNATDKSGNPVREFRIPLKLTISYSAATNVTDPARLNIYYVVNGAPVESLNGAIDKLRQTVSGNVFHFSTYVIGTD